MGNIQILFFFLGAPAIRWCYRYSAWKVFVLGLDSFLNSVNSGKGEAPRFRSSTTKATFISWRATNNHQSFNVYRNYPTTAVYRFFQNAQHFSDCAKPPVQSYLLSLTGSTLNRINFYLDTDTVNRSRKPRTRVKYSLPLAAHDLHFCFSRFRCVHHKYLRYCRNHFDALQTYPAGCRPIKQFYECCKLAL